MTRRGILRWFGWSAAAHLALGAALWIALPRIHAPSLPASDAAVTVVSLVGAPDQKIPARRPVPRPVPSLLLPPLPKGGGGDLPLAPVNPQPVDAVDAMDDSDFGQPAPMSDVPAPQDNAPSAPEPSPTATDVAATVATTATAGATTDDYRPLVLAMLERAKRYPLLAQRRGLEGTVEIAFMIHADGQLSDPELIASSTHDVLDDAALAIVRRLGSVPPPPHRNTVRFPARIQYRLDP